MHELSQSLDENPTDAIQLRDVRKIYRLHGSHTDQLIEVLGLQRFGLHPKTKAQEFAALKGVNLTIPRGERVGIVGRNGAGKSTLLKLICGNVTQTSGSVIVNGTVQALLSAGAGFNPDYTGAENLEASLHYNGLNRADYAAAIEDIKDFCELGDFFDQPFKTYSAGMQSRLMFAAATAVRPEILIVDEVLGAGDAYFIAKSRRRVEHLVKTGCTMLLVSHAMSQILELCERAIWMRDGQIELEGDSFEVVKAYEAYVHGAIHYGGLDLPTSPEQSTPDADETPSGTDDQHSRFVAEIQPTSETFATVPSQMLDTVSTIDDTNDATVFDTSESEATLHKTKNKVGGITIVRPDAFQVTTHSLDSTQNLFPSATSPLGFNFVTRSGISPWEGTRNITFSGFTILSQNGPTSKLVNLAPARIVLEVTAHKTAQFNLRYAVVVYDHFGRAKINLCSGEDLCDLSKGERRLVEVDLTPVQLGPGEYIVSLGLYDHKPLEMINSTMCHDLLSRSFEFQVVLPETLQPVACEFSHPANWHFGR